MKKIIYPVITALLFALATVFQFQTTADATTARHYTISVPVQSSYYNMQSAINRNPAVYINYNGWGFSEIASHNYFEGKTFLKFKVGDVVTVHGKHAGKYKITSIRTVRNGAKLTSIPKGFAFQTCNHHGSTNLYYAKKI